MKSVSVLLSTFLLLASCGGARKNGVDAFYLVTNSPPTTTTNKKAKTRKTTKWYPGLAYAPEDREVEMREVFRRGEEEPLFDHDDWVRHRTRRAEESENVATALFGGFALFLWFVGVQF